MHWLRGPRAHAAFALLLFAATGCRGESKRPPSDVKPADEKLAWPALDDSALTAAIETSGYTRGLPEPLAIAPDGSVVFRRAKPRDPVADLYLLDPAGKATLLAGAQALLAMTPPAQPAAPAAPAAPAGTAAGSAAPGSPPADSPDRAPRGIESISMSDDGARICVPLAGRLFVIERATGAARELAVGEHRDAQLSPDGKLVAYVQAGDLWVAPTAGGAPTRLTQHPADRDYAVAETGASAFGRTRGFWWSPDSQALAFQRTDLTKVDTVYLGDASHPERAPVAQKRALAGRPVPVVDLGVVSVRGGAPRWTTWDTARYPYLTRVVWPARGVLTLVVLGREQTQLAALAADPATGATRELVVDKDATWINVGPEPVTWLPDGSGLLWMTEADGAWGLVRYGADGKKVATVMTPHLGLRRVLAVTADSLIAETTIDPRQRGVAKLPLSGEGAPVSLTPEGGVHVALAAHGVVVVSSALRAGGHSVTAIAADGKRRELPSVAERPRAPATTKLEEIRLDDHIQYASVTRPHAFDPKVRYPVIVRIDGEPSSVTVLDAPDTYLVDQALADAGFIVVRTDSRGTPGRDAIWQRAIAGDVLTVPINDQIGVIKVLGARFPELDRARVGLLGAGFGGFLATVGAMIHPESFAAAVAHAPITDWELVDAAYAERYLKTPVTNADGYRRASARSYAEQLQRPLLIVEVTDDGRLPFAHSMALVEALGAAGKQISFATRPAAPSLPVALASLKRDLEFLRAQLGPPVRPAVMPTARTEEEEEEEERERERRGK